MEIFTKTFLTFSLAYFSAMILMVITKTPPAQCGVLATWAGSCAGLIYLNISAFIEIKQHKRKRNEKTQRFRCNP